MPRCPRCFFGAVLLAVGFVTNRQGQSNPLGMRFLLLLMATLVPPVHGVAQDLRTYRERARSDDAATIEEAFFHAEARALVIQEIEPNRLRVAGRDLRVKRHPNGLGCFVYEPRTRFNGVERKIVWWVSEDKAAFVVNGATAPLTPTLEYSLGMLPQSAAEIAAYVFDGRPFQAVATEKPRSETTRSFTVKEYQAYRSIMDMPMSVSQEQAYVRVARCHGLTAAQVRDITRKVQEILLQNSWFGTPTAEVRHATDWSGQQPTGKCVEGSWRLSSGIVRCREIRTGGMVSASSEHLAGAALKR